MNGVLLINKEIGKTSRDMVNELNHIFGIKKIGHTGTLDPLATGVLVMCIGKYTKLVDHLSSLEKEYNAEVKLGIKTDTLDITGNVLEQKDTTIDKESLEKTLKTMIGIYKQTIPAYSAKKVNGKKLYEYARNGEEVPTITNEVEILDIKLLEYNNDSFRFWCKVSKGTYIRSIIETICNKLNVIGTMSSLERCKQGVFSINDSYTIKDIKKGNYKLLHLKDLFTYPEVDLTEEDYKKVLNGNKMNFNSQSRYIILNYNHEEVALYQKKDNEYRLILFVK